MDDLEAILKEAKRRIDAMTPEEFDAGLKRAIAEAERINAEYAVKTRMNWRDLHEPMTI